MKRKKQKVEYWNRKKLKNNRKKNMWKFKLIHNICVGFCLIDKRRKWIVLNLHLRLSLGKNFTTEFFSYGNEWEKWYVWWEILVHLFSEAERCNSVGEGKGLEVISLASFGMEEHEPKLDRVCRLFIRVVNISKKRKNNQTIIQEFEKKKKNLQKS